MPFTLQSFKAWEWGCRSAVLLSKLMEGGYGRRQMRRKALCFNSRCRLLMIELSRYAFESLRTDQEFILYRARRSGERSSVEREAFFAKDFGELSRAATADESQNKDLSSILVLAPALEQPEMGTLKRLEHECSLRDELDPEWAVRPIALTHHWDRSVLVL